MLKSDVEHIQNQLQVARNEINNLRKQIRALHHKQRADIDNIFAVLNNYRCEGCRTLNNTDKRSNGEVNIPLAQSTVMKSEYRNWNEQGLRQQQKQNGVESLNSIGTLFTLFPEKRAVPRQANVGCHLRGTIKLNTDLFTNPEHALQGLDDYSHMWILYHFNKNTSHPKAKVAPPCLGGERIGVFATRSPHRPCPIGLSLVEIEKIEGSTVHFLGTDMVDGTPVLDIKPYIPYYDSPKSCEIGSVPTGLLENNAGFYGSRQEPDGEETAVDMLGASVVPQVASDVVPLPLHIKVPTWVQTSNRLHVDFNERSRAQLQELNIQKECIINVLESDPRSVYLRTKYSSQIFTFQLGNIQVTCKFDDKNCNVTVLQIRPTECTPGIDLLTNVAQVIKKA